MIRPLRATYRLQFNKDFGFGEALRLVDYLAELGISHLYASPIMTATPGSNHGYDVVDPTRINPELGTEAAFDDLVAGLHRREMGLILDIVPNHMGIGTGNAWWMDVLEWGRLSPYAVFFDIDWQAGDGKLLLPVLGDPFGTVLEAGDIALHFDRDTGRFALRYGTHRFPVAPWCYDDILLPAAAALEGPAASKLRALGAAFAALGDAKPAALPRPDGLHKDLACFVKNEDEVSRALDRRLRAYKGRAGATETGHLLDRQPYRPIWWRAGNDRINYRRFFDIDSLAGLCVESEQVFEATHAKILDLVEAGKIDGLRIDHIDGLKDPKAYLRRLRDACIARGADIPILVEKILGEGETLPSSWPVAGTTGYDDLNLLSRLFMEPGGEVQTTASYEIFAHASKSFDAVLVESKSQIVHDNLASEVARLTSAVCRLAAGDWRYRDFTERAIRRGLENALIHLPVYRTYVDRDGATPEDRAVLGVAMAEVGRDGPAAEAPLHAFLAEVLSGTGGPAACEIAQRFQQISGPAMAKGLEDTSFYRYVRAIVLNEVGGDPRVFSIDLESFHRRMAARPARSPSTLVAGTTHDTKRGEDARARLVCLSSVPGLWMAAAGRWRRLGDCAAALHPGDVYYFYQSLIGAWPADLDPGDQKGLDALAERLNGAMLKAVREGKRRSSWIDPDTAYEETLTHYIRMLLNVRHPFLADFHQVAMRGAFWGAWTSLAQTLVRCTMPGVPDIYRGAEQWDVSLVDPDNRRPLDIARLRAGITGEGCSMADWRDGRIKQRMIKNILAARRDRPALFTMGDYAPCRATGDKADHVVAFMREGADGAAALSVAGRFWPGLLPEADCAPAWGDTSLAVPPGYYVDALSGRRYDIGAAPMRLADLLGDFPACLLLRQA